MPLPEQTFSNYDDLRAYINTYIVSNGGRDITGTEHNNVENALLTFLINSPLNASKVDIHSTGGVYALSKGITYFNGFTPTQVSFGDNNQFEWYIINATSADIPLAAGSHYFNMQVEQSVIPANVVIHVAKSQNNQWLQVNNSEITGSGISGYSGYSGLGLSGFSGYSGLGLSGYSGYSGLGLSGYSGQSGYSGFSGKSGYSGFSGGSGYSGYSGSGLSGYSGYSGSGVSGYSGYSGTGFSGYSGFSGLNGIASASGYSGYSGLSGYSGYSGKSGYSGYSGSGVSGYSGYSGAGLSGFSGYSGAGQSGYSGYSGSGVSGYSGYSGTGLSGFSGYSGVGQSGYSGYSGKSGYSGYSGLSGYSGFSGNGQSGYSGYSGSGSGDIVNTTFAGLRANTAPLTTVRYNMTDLGKEGLWWYDNSDSTTADNIATVIVSSNGKRFKRVYDQEHIDVRWFDLQGDNSDETAKLQYAINNSDGKALMFNKITIRTGGNFSGYSIIVGGSNRKFISDGAVMKYIANGAQPSYFWYFNNVTNFEFKGFEFDMENLAGNETSGTVVLWFETCPYLKCHFNYVHNNGHAGIFVLGGNFITVDHNIVRITDSAIFCVRSAFADSGTDGADDLIITNNLIDGGTSEGIGVFSHGDVSTINKRWIVANNVVKNKMNSAGFNCCRSKYGLITNNVVSNCLNGIHLQDAGGAFAYNEFSTDISITNNLFTDLGGIGIGNLSDRCQAIGNTFTNVYLTSILTNLHLDSGGNNHNVTVTGCVIKDNQIYNGSYGNISFPCIDLQDLRYSFIQNNNISQSISSVTAIRIYDLDTCTVEGNNCWDSKIYHLPTDTLSYGKRVIFRNNVFLDATNDTTYPISGGVYNWIWENNRYITYENDPTNFAYDLSVSSGALNSIHDRFIRDNYYIAASQTITSIAASWFGRIITFQAKGAATFNNGSNISNIGGGNLTLSAGQSVTYRYDGATWREKFHSLS